MKIYKLLMTNRIREYIRLFKNMYIQIIGLIILGIISVSTIMKWYWPILSQMNKLNCGTFYIIICVILIFSLYKSLGHVKPAIIVKPMTLFLLDTERLKKILHFKYLYYEFKYLVLSLIFTICTCGLNVNFSFIKICLIFFACLSTSLYAAWSIYNSEIRFKKCLFKIAVLINNILCILALNYTFFLIGVYLLLGCLIVYAVVNIKINYYKYTEDMVYMEKILTAQNSNNMILLTQYAKEKVAMSVSRTRPESRLLKKSPLLWKTFTSIIRIGKNGIIIGICIFSITFAISKVEFFWQFPIIDIEQTRYVLLLGGVFFLYQICVQTFVKQLNDIVEKQKDGLYIPIRTGNIILQFAIVPSIILTVLTFILGILLRSQILFVFIFYSVLLAYLVITLFMNVFNRRLLEKVYAVFSILILLISNLLLL